MLLRFDVMCCTVLLLLLLVGLVSVYVRAIAYFVNKTVTCEAAGVF